MESELSSHFVKICRAVQFTSFYDFQIHLKLAFDDVEYPETNILVQKSSQFKDFKAYIGKAQEKLVDQRLSNQDQVTNFYKQLLIQMIGIPEIDLSATVDFQNPESVRTTLERNSLSKRQSKPKVILVISPIPNRHKDNKENKSQHNYDEELSVHELLEYMAPYVYQEPATQNFIGIILTLNNAQIVWIWNFDPKKPLGRDSIWLYTLSWTFIAFEELLENIQNQEEKTIKWGDISQFYIFFDFLKRLCT